MSNSKLFIIFFFMYFFATFVSSISLNNSIHKCSEKQSEALLLFKQNLSSINATIYGLFHSPIMMNWNASTDCCNWNGVSCDYSTGDVIGLEVSFGMLKGTIHPNTSLFSLPRLQRLDLSFNNFSGSQIPRGIGRFANSLTHLNLAGCLFSGQVPPEITHLHKLVSLDLSDYFEVDLKLAPHVFINMLHNFTNLEKLSLDYVNISSVLPTSLNISSSLKILSLKSTGMKGKLPHYIFNLHSLESLQLGDNSFTGDLPPEILVNLTHLSFLDLASNKLNGTLPTWLYTSPSLQYIFLSINMFSGNVPFESFALPSLKFLFLSYNELAGQIDVQIFRQLTNLTHLDLSFNNFSGELELDTLLSSLANLEQLDLSYSGFFVTTKNGNHYVNRGFTDLGLASCKLKVFPNSFRAMRQLEWLDLSGNEIHGQIPHWAREIGDNALSYLNLSHNFITGLPKMQWYGLEELDLQSNLIEGPFPPSICNMGSLRYLDMSNNRFGGLIPQCFGNITSSLSMIDMGNNSFQGTIPSLYGGCEGLEGLILNENQLEGEVPSTLSKCRSLKVVDFGNNNLNGTFPGWLGDLPNLLVLVLKSNNFHGLIQPSSTVESSFPSLRVLDLSHNGFVGQLPAKYFQNFSSMKNVVKNSTEPEYVDMGGTYYSFVVAVKGLDQDIPRLFVGLTIIDLSNNRFEKGIPEIIGNLSSLKVLNLSHNSLNGRIPNSLGKLSEIESLDLSWNQLTGNIPGRLADLTFLEFLNLSTNHLEGSIPQGNQLKTFEENSYYGNPKLCGFPLPRKCNEYLHETRLEADDDEGEESGFPWKMAMLGYGCGTIIGLVTGYLMLSSTRPNRLNAIADAGEYMILKRRDNRRRVHMRK